MKKPIAAYIHRPQPTEPLVLRFSADLKEKLKVAAKQMDTSVNRFVEAAVINYLDNLKKEKYL